jgi:hypothetical protein
MDNSVKNIKKAWMSSLSFLDNCYVNTAILIILFLYCTTIFDNINSAVGSSYNYSIVKIIVLLLIVYIAPKDTTIAILLAMTYIISLIYMHNSEAFSSMMPSYNMKSENESFNNNMTSENELFNNTMTSENELFNNHMKAENETYRNKMTAENESYRNKMIAENESFKNKEHFFPFIDQQDSNGNNFKSNEVSSEQKNYNNQMSNSLSTADCMLNYVPQTEAVGNVCAPVATFTNELNAQGLNFPEGFDFPGTTGSPLIQN